MTATYTPTAIILSTTTLITVESELFYSINCGAESTKKFSSSPINILPSDFTNTEFQEGVYSFSAKIPQSNGFLEENVCLLHAPSLPCKVAANPTTEVLNAYLALTFAQECSSCSCSNLCLLYNNLLSLLNATDSPCSNC